MLPHFSRLKSWHHFFLKLSIFCPWIPEFYLKGMKGIFENMQIRHSLDVKYDEDSRLLPACFQD